MKYKSLFNLLEQEKQANEYYFGLPEYVRSSIAQRADNVNSYESLKDYAENLLRGDC